MQSGLIPVKVPDLRNLNHEVQFGAIDPSKLDPKGLGRKPLSIKNQRGTQFCTAYGTATASEYIEEIEMSPEYQAALISEVAGEPILSGASAKNSLKALKLFGSLPKKDAPYSLDVEGEVFVANLKNWPKDLTQTADDYLKASYYDVLHGSHDAFDNIKSALATAKEQGENRVAIAYTQWFSNWGGKKPFKRGTGSFSWHCHLFIDWSVKDGQEVLVGHNSYGTEWGDNGLSYWTREAVNQLLEDNRNEVFMVRDLTPETAKDAQWGLAVTIYDMLVKTDPTGAIQWLIEFFNNWLNGWKAPIVVPPVTPTPVPPVVTPEPASETLAEATELFLGKDAAPRNLAPAELSCAEAVTNIINTAFPGTLSKNIVSTIELDKALKASKRFKGTLNMKRGNVVIYPTKGDNIGHTLICLEDDDGKKNKMTLASNNSFGGVKGLFTKNYSRKSARDYFIGKKGLVGRIYEPVDIV
jgi:hypothetical protein